MRIGGIRLITLVLAAAVLRAAIVSKPGDSCVTPRPEFGDEDLSTNPGGALAEWTASLKALPDGPVKTDLLTRLLHTVISPDSFFSDKDAMRDFLRKALPPLYMRPPFQSNSPFQDGTKTVIGGGWIYNNGGSHRGVDISRQGWSSNADPSIDVFAVADGKVIGVYFDGPPGGGGNTIIIEHTGTNGRKVYSFYMHLRDGRTHDVAAVKAIVCPANDSNCVKYRKMAINYPNHPAWGTDADKILVKPGDSVHQGQKIAKSGNTMTAEGHVGDDGRPPDNATNNHLHIYTAVPSPNDPKTVIYVDPYGVYDEASSGCYQPAAKTFFHPFFAPFPRDFGSVAADWFQTGFDYYVTIGEWPAALSAYKVGGATVMAGTFKSGPNRPVRTLMTFDQATDYFNEYKKEGFRPDQVGVLNSGGPKISAIYQPINGEFLANCGMNLADFSTVEQKNPGYSVIDISAYVDGDTKWCGVWVKKNLPHRVQVGLTPDSFTKYNADYRKQGFQVTKFISYGSGGSRRTAALWQQVSGDWKLVREADPTSAQTQYNALIGQGYRVAYVNGNDGLLSTVFNK
jgi:murein DD-endopeptidase MepM/ murein hydrolase activator NlpD